MCTAAPRNQVRWGTEERGQQLAKCWTLAKSPDTEAWPAHEQGSLDLLAQRLFFDVGPGCGCVDGRNMKT